MASIVYWDGTLAVPKSLRRDHDNARAELVRAAMEGGQIAKTGRSVARLCLPQFDHEEKSVFPVLALLPYMAAHELRREMLRVLPMISAFRAEYDALREHHRAVLCAIDALMQAANRAKNREFAEFAHELRVHEDLEDEVIFPTVVLIGNCLQQRFGA